MFNCTEERFFHRVCIEGEIMDYKEILDNISERYNEILGTEFVGLYVHGSIAMKCYNHNKSDIDFIVVSRTEPTDDIKLKLIDTIMEIEPLGPEKGIEMHLMLYKDCIKFQHPSYFSLHYSKTHTNWFLRDPDDYVKNMKGIDPDLAAHCTILSARGVTWRGEPKDIVFGKVPKEAYIDSILGDVSYAENNSDSMYQVLTYCRVAAYVEEEKILSKQEGGEWGLVNLPTCYHEVIKKALHCYQTDENMDDSDGLKEFFNYMKTRILK